MMTGGLSEVTLDTHESEQIGNFIKQEALQKYSKDFSSVKVVKCAKQVVAGINYFLKVDVGDGKYIHARVFKSLPHEGGAFVLGKIQEDKTVDDPIVYF